MLFNSSKYSQAFFLTDLSDLLKTLRSGSSPALEGLQETALTLPAAELVGDHSLPTGGSEHPRLHYPIFLGKGKAHPSESSQTTAGGEKQVLYTVLCLPPTSSVTLLALAVQQQHIK